jgi:hypothetical protein
MKIIKQGVLPENTFYHGTCSHCKCQVECNLLEVTQKNMGDRYSGEVIEHYVLCPTQGCGRRIILEEGKFPTYLC